MNILIVGLGGMGMVHICNIEHIPFSHIAGAVGATGIDRKKAEEKGIPFFSSIDEAFQSGLDIDVVDITTPTFLHKENVLQALNYGVDVICEKPLCLKSEDAEMLYKKAEEKGCKLIVAQVLRFTKEYKALKKAIVDKEYGNVLEGTFTRLSSEPKWARDGWLFEKDKSGLVPFDLHIHDLDMIISIFGVPKDVKSESASVKGESYSNYYHFDYGYDGFSLHAEAGWLKASIPFTATWRVIFEHGVIVNDGKNVTIYPEDSDPILVDTTYDVVVSTGINVPPTGWYYEELYDILFSIFSEKNTNPVPKDEIISVLKVLEKI